MIWSAIIVLLALAVAFIIARAPIAEVEAQVAGGRIGPGCVVAQSVILAAIAVVIFFLRQGL